jgi:hypothetical protein
LSTAKFGAAVRYAGTPFLTEQSFACHGSEKAIDVRYAITLLLSGMGAPDDLVHTIR